MKYTVLEELSADYISDYTPNAATLNFTSDVSTSVMVVLLVCHT
jgi:hypothetical protein